MIAFRNRHHLKEHEVYMLDHQAVRPVEPNVQNQITNALLQQIADLRAELASNKGLRDRIRMDG